VQNGDLTLFFDDWIDCSSLIAGLTNFGAASRLVSVCVADVKSILASNVTRSVRRSTW